MEEDWKAIRWTLLRQWYELELERETSEDTLVNTSKAECSYKALMKELKLDESKYSFEKVHRTRPKIYSQLNISVEQIHEAMPPRPGALAEMKAARQYLSCEFAR